MGLSPEMRAIALVKKYDGEFPKKYFNEILNYLNINEKEFNETIDKFRPKHIWKNQTAHGTKACCLDESKKIIYPLKT